MNFSGIWHGLDEALFMFWDTLWALVLGFGLSGAVQAFISRGEMRNALGDHRPATLATSSFFGVISSSCSYASAALAKSCSAAVRTSPRRWSSWSPPPIWSSNSSRSAATARCPPATRTTGWVHRHSGVGARFDRPTRWLLDLWVRQ